MTSPTEHGAARGSRSAAAPGSKRAPPVSEGREAAGRPDVQLQVDDDSRGIRLLQALSGAAREMHRSLSLDEVVRVATERSRELVRAEEAATSQAVDGDWARGFTTRAGGDDADGTSPDVSPTRLQPPTLGGGGPANEVCRTNRSLRLSWSDDRRTDPGSGGSPPTRGAERSGTGSWLGAPLVGSDGRNLGLIQLADRIGAGEFSASDEAVLLQLARMASVAIENARLYETALDTRSQLAWAAHVERVRAAELRAVINAMGEAVLVCDGAGRVHIVNPAADTLFEGRPVQTYDDLLSRFREVDESPVDPIAAAAELHLEERPGVWVELRVYPVRGDARQPGGGEDAGGRIAVMRDISAARQARAQREAFLGILSHELRTPITTIYAGSKVLARDEPLDAATSRELANDISSEAERLFRLVEDLLVMTRIERGVLELANEPVLLQRVAAGAIRLESAHWPSTRIRLAGVVDLPAVSGDATYVEQVVRNLLSNAAKYSPPDAEVEVRLEIEEDGLICCRVLDRGRGFQSGEAEDLFDLFYRSPATAAQAAGAGIGLFVCRRLVTAMGGRIWARPRPGGGAEFGFGLRRYGDAE